MAKLTDKLKGVLTEEDLSQFETAINEMVGDKVKVIEDEMKVKYDKISKEFVDKAILEGTETLKTTMEDEYETKLGALEEAYVEKLDAFLEHEISENISEDSVKAIAVNETLQPLVAGIQKLFAEHFINLDSEGANLLNQAKVEIDNLTETVNSLTSEKLDLLEKVEGLAKLQLIAEKTEGMTVEQKQRVNEMFEGKSFDELSDKIDSFVEIVLETKVEKNDTVNENKDPEIVGDKPIITEVVTKDGNPTVATANDLLNMF